MNVAVGGESISVIDEANTNVGGDELVVGDRHPGVGAAKTDAG